MKIAFEKRSPTKIFLRKLINRAVSAPRKIAHSGTPISHLALWPPVKTLAEWELLNERVTWYLPRDVKVTATSELEPPSPSRITTTDGTAHLSAAQRVLLWKWKSIFSPEIIRRIHLTEMGDPWFYSTVECDTWTKLFSRSSSPLVEHTDRVSNKNFWAMKDALSGRRVSYVFTTGPSIASAKNFTYPQSAIKIICNSMVKDESLLEHIKPDVLTFADPVFHFSANRYSVEFRRLMLRCVEKFSCYCVVPAAYASLLLAHHPSLENRIIGVHSDPEATDWLVPECNALTVKPTENILTMLMLPIAARLSDEINILGADGRKPDEKYFWKHNASTQMTDLMSDVERMHPSFFRDRSYVDYYDKHCAIMSNWCERLEKDGKKITSLTTSYIPALATRFSGAT